MDRPLFSDMLYDRRRELGLSIKQASNVLRLKEEVLVAFEEGDFDSIPKSGYAQGMLSSYARYLGLNAKTVVNQFSQDLFEHERGAGSHEARRRSRLSRGNDDGPLYETPQANAPNSGRNRTYVESHGFLPTSGGFAGDMGDFATTSEARPRYSSNQSNRDYEFDSYPQGRPYTARVPYTSAGVSPLGQAQRQRPMSRSGSYGSSDSYAGSNRHSAGSYSSRDDITTRRVAPSQYRDDMRLDNAGGSYQSASSVAGRRSSRNIASTQRPNVQRRASRSTRDASRARGRDQGPAHGGIIGMIELFFQDRSRVLALVVAVLCVALVAIIAVSVNSCVSTRQNNEGTIPVTHTSDQTTTTNEQESMTDEEERRAREEAAAAKAAESESAVTERTIEVTVAENEVTWLEIEYDGKSDVAETVTGPWNRTYTVRQSISINVNDTTAVTVTENGKKLEFDSKASGIGTITIQVSKAGTTEDTTQDPNTTTDPNQQTNQDGTQTQQGTPDATQTTTGDQTQQQTQPTDMTQQQQQQAQPQTGTNPYPGYTLDSDGYYYGADGYYDANGNFYQY